MAGRNDKGKGKKVARKTKKSISRARVAVSMMNAPSLVIGEPDSNDGRVSKGSRAADINEVVHKLFLVNLASSYKNFVARMKRSALRRAKITVALQVWKRWVRYWCDEKQLKISFINSKNRRSQDGGMGTHADWSRSHTRSSALIVDSTGEMPSIAKRLKLEWTDVVKNKYGPDAEVDENRDGDLYITFPSVKAKKKKGRVFGYGQAKDAYLKFDGCSSSQQARNSVGMSQEIATMLHEAWCFFDGCSSSQQDSNDVVSGMMFF
ncbi:hypothetical protein LIER_18361 [Lithospermum erythrorhizon]|uniref:Uncharacterized protein n=1 Tax=Lithospermum erythrorhizon TaxID=34254 RepID=A0AAV3QG34_LITER